MRAGYNAARKTHKDADGISTLTPAQRAYSPRVRPQRLHRVIERLDLDLDVCGGACGLGKVHGAGRVFVLREQEQQRVEVGSRQREPGVRLERFRMSGDWL